MGERGSAFVDVAALYDVAAEYQATADAIDAVVRTRLSGLRFGGAAAGHLHTARGDAVRVAVDRIVDQLGHWSRASREVAFALRASVDRYADADDRAGRRVGR